MRTIGESKTRLVIPTASLTTGEVYLYKTAHHDSLKQHYQEKAVDVALAASAFPTYFPTHFVENGIPLIDGGIWANNPAGIGAVESSGILDWNPEHVKMLSLGCTQEPFDYKPAFWKRKGNFIELLNFIARAQSSNAIGTAKALLGEENVIRINHTAPEGKFKLDGTHFYPNLGESRQRKSAT